MNEELRFVETDDPLGEEYQEVVIPLWSDVVNSDVACQKRTRQLEILLALLERHFNSEEANYSFVVSHTVADLHCEMFCSLDDCSQELLRKVLRWCRKICLSQPIVNGATFDIPECLRKLQYLFITSLDVFAEPPRDKIAEEFFIDNLKQHNAEWITFCAFAEIESFAEVLHAMWIASGEQISNFPEASLQQFISVWCTEDS